MKKISKILMLLVVFTFVSASLFAGGAKETASKKKSIIELTKEETKAGWQYLMPIGFKVNKKEWSEKYDNNLFVGDEMGEETGDKPIYKGYKYDFVSDEWIKKFIKLREDKTMPMAAKQEKYEKELIPAVMPVFALITLNTAYIDKDLKEITGYPINEVISKNKKYTHVFALAKPSNRGLNEAATKTYTQMIEDAHKIKDTITCVDPISPASILMGIKKLKFETVDLEGKPVTSDILKDYDVTMINIWSTKCGYCINEMPALQKLYENFKDKKCNIIGLTWNASDKNPQAIDDAKKIVEKAGCKYTIVQNNLNLENIFRKGITGLPTSLFVDKNANVIATSTDDIIVGAMDLKAFTKAMEKALEAVSK